MRQVSFGFVEHLLVPSSAVLHFVGCEIFGRKAGVKFPGWPGLPNLVKDHPFLDHVQKAGVNDSDRIPDGDEILPF